MKIKDYLFLVLILVLGFFVIDSFFKNRRLARLVNAYEKELKAENKKWGKKIDSLILQKADFLKLNDSLIQIIKKKDTIIIYKTYLRNEKNKRIVNSRDIDSIKRSITSHY